MSLSTMSQVQIILQGKHVAMFQVLIATPAHSSGQTHRQFCRKKETPDN